MEKTKVKVSVSGLDENPTKAEEVEVVVQLVEKFRGKGWYLSSLFGTGLLAWFEGQAAQDVNCNVMLELEAAREHALKAVGIARKAVADIEANARDHDRKLSQFRDGYRSEIEKLKQELESAKGREAEYADGLEKERQQREEADRTIRQNRSTIDVLEAEVIKLKARLYDLMDKGVMADE
jgi:hypothetical protein